MYIYTKLKILQTEYGFIYLCLHVQNSIIQINGKIIRGVICDEAQQSGYFSLMADETKDMRQEQLVVVVRCKKALLINFFTFVQATNINAESLPNYLIKVLEDNELDPVQYHKDAMEPQS